MIRQSASGTDTPHFSPTSTMVHSSLEQDDPLERQSSRPTEKAGQHALDEEERISSGSGEEETSAPASSDVPNKEDEDRWLVRWEGQDDPGDPLNTPAWKKW